jgi:hypothetical protein
VRSQVKHPRLEVLHIEFDSDRRQWRAHGHTIDLLVELAIEAEVCGQYVKEESQDILFEISA